MFFSVEHQANKSEHACNDIALSAVFRSNGRSMLQVTFQHSFLNRPL